MNNVITIARQYGSCGREIGKRLAAKYNIKCYDKELITMAAQKNGMDSDVLEMVDEKASNSLLYTLAFGSSLVYSTNSSTMLPVNDKLFISQSEVIKEISKNPCVIVGRCADYVLSDNKNIVRVFIYSELSDRINQIMKRNEVSEKEAKDQIIKMDKRRSNYYNYYTGAKWGSNETYDLSISTSKLGLDGTVNVISTFIDSMENS